MVKKYKSIFGLFFAIQLSSLAIVLFIKANLGSDTITVFEEGLSKSLGCTLGQASIIYNLMILPIALLLNYKNIGFSTFLYSLFVGFFIDFYEMALLNFEIQSILVRMFCVLIAQCLFAISYALLILLRKGMSFTDACVNGMAEKFHIDYKYMRTMWDFLTLTTGFLLGGTVGLGSILTMFLTGMSVHIAITHLSWLTDNKL